MDVEIVINPHDKKPADLQSQAVAVFLRAKHADPLLVRLPLSVLVQPGVFRQDNAGGIRQGRHRQGR